MERSLGHRAPVLWLLLPTMVGFAVARALPPGWGGGWWLVVALLGVLVVLLALRRASWWARGCWAGGVVLAVGAAAVAYFQVREGRLVVWEQLPAREAELVLEVERVFPPVAGRVTTTGLARIVEAPAVIGETVGQRIYFALPVPEGIELLASARVRARGVLNPLPRTGGAGFADYLARSGVAFRFNRARWLAEVRVPSAFRRFCATAAWRFERILGAGLGDQPALRSILVAMLLGQKAELSEEQRELFLHSGTMHLFAISGLHIAVIWAVVGGLLTLARVPKPLAIAAGLPALLLYVEITGGAPSARRAWLMIAFVLAARALRWARNPLAGIAASALVVLWWNPWQLFGLGFQMSYAVVAALLLYGLPLEERWQRRWKPWADIPPADWGWWRQVVRAVGAKVITGTALAVAATLVSVPMTLANFGLMTPGSLVVNLVCIPAAGLVIVAGICSIVAGLLGLLPVSVLCNHAAVLTLAGMDRLLAGATWLPGSYWSAQFRAEWLGTGVLVMLLGLLVAGYALWWRRTVGGLWGPVAVLLLALLVLVHHGAPVPATEAVAGAGAANLPARTAPAIAPVR